MKTQIDLERLLTNELTPYVEEIMNNAQGMKRSIIEAMKESCKQILKLAYENIEVNLVNSKDDISEFWEYSHPWRLETY